MPCSTLASIKMASNSRTSLGVSSHKACGALPQRPATWLRSSCHLFRFNTTEAEPSRAGGLGGRRLLFPLLPLVLCSFHDFVEGLRSRMAYEQLPSTASVPHLLRRHEGQGAAALAAEAALHVCRAPAVFLVAAWRELGSGGEADCCADLSSSREATQAKSMNRAGFRKHPPTRDATQPAHDLRYYL